MLLLDTSAVSAVMHRIPAALARLRHREPWKVVLCSPVAAEIHYGLARLPTGSRRRLLLSSEFERLREVAHWSDWSETAAREFGRHKALLEERGTRLDDMDLIVASVALTLRACVATFNSRHFTRIEGVEVEDWATEPEDPRGSASSTT
jgi:tRNA(fMet)-specific endonuclease VapC